MREKIKAWWSSDGQWFCVLVDDGVNKATVSLTPEEAANLGFNIMWRATLAGTADQSSTGAVK